ncbi:hypothetical protein ACFLRO_02520 [Bacteroidota bacterium]
MPFSFADDDLKRISGVLGVPEVQDGGLVRYGLHDSQSGRKLALELHRGITLPPELGESPVTLVSVYATNSFLQLHGCTGYIASQELGEVIFFARQRGSTNGLVVERGAGCSLYACVDDRLLSADFTLLPPEVMMSSVALSMTETLFNDFG